MKLFSRKRESDKAVSLSPALYSAHPFSAIRAYVPLSRAQNELYQSLREAVPVIDAAIGKLVRLIGTFEVSCEDHKAQAALRDFLSRVRVGAAGAGIYTFLSAYFDQLLTYGTAVGEIVPDGTGRVAGLYNASLSDIELMQGDNPMQVSVCVRDSGRLTPAAHPERVLLSLLNPTPGTVQGNSILSGLPFVSAILLRVLATMDKNFERVGNVRFAVTYKPAQGAGTVNAKARAEEIAREWSRAMRDSSQVSDFVSVGDVSIRAIGADNQVLDYEVPVRLILEQIVSKLSIPPFLLGFSWSSTERMSAQQADILTSELEYYRTLLQPVVEKICRAFLIAEGYAGELTIEWSNISLQDETELASARLNNARAMQLEQQLEVNE